MFAPASCRPSYPACSSMRPARFVIPEPCNILFNLPSFIGANSDIPTNAPNRVALLRSSCVAPYSLARSDASPAPAPVAKPAAKGSPTPGIKAVPARGTNEPRASPNLPSTVSSSPMSAVCLT